MNGASRLREYPILKPALPKTKANAQTVRYVFHFFLRKFADIPLHPSFVDRSGRLAYRHRWGAQAAIANDAVGRQGLLFDFCCKRYDDQDRRKVLSAVVLDHDSRSDTALFTATARIQIHKVYIAAFIMPSCFERFRL